MPKRGLQGICYLHQRWRTYLRAVLCSNRHGDASRIFCKEEFSYLGRYVSRSIHGHLRVMLFHGVLVLISFQRDFVREPGPATFISSCAVFTLCLAHLMQHTSHHRYQNTFILCGTICGVLIGVFTAAHGLILVSAVTAYLPVSIIVAQVLSLLVHTILSSCPDPVPCRHGNAERTVNSERKKSGISG